MCQHLSNHDVAVSLSRVTGSGYENSLMSLNQMGSPRVLNLGGSVDMKAFASIARRSPLASELSICRELSSLTGKGFENVMMDFNRIEIGR